MNAHKNIDLEIMRIIACFFVIFNHTGANGFFLFSSKEIGSLPFWLYMIVADFCKISVPLFFAISGSLLLSKEESFKTIFCRRIFKIASVLVCFSLFYYLTEIYFNNTPFEATVFIRRLITSNLNFSYWYLYSFIAFLISLPFLRSMVTNLQTTHFIYMIILGVVTCGAIPVIEYLLWSGQSYINPNIKIGWICSTIFIYPCLGYFLYHKINYYKIKKFIPLLWALNTLTISIDVYMTYYKALITNELNEQVSQTFLGGFVILNCITVFISIVYFCQNHTIPARIERIIKSISSCTFGIYLLHVFIMNRIWNKLNLWTILNKELQFNEMLSAFIFCLLTMLLGYVITLLLKKIPILKKLV